MITLGLAPRLRRSLAALALTTASLLGVSSNASADVIESANGDFKAGIDSLGNLYDGNAGIGLQRVSDGYDAISPGTPREAWGVVADGNSGYVDSFYYGVSNIVANGAASFGANSAFISTFLQDASLTNILQIDQYYSFIGAAQNVLRIDILVTNVSGAFLENVQFSRNVDWDIAPSQFYETITVGAFADPILAASYYGFENPDPTAPFFFGAPPSGGFFGPSDLGAGLLNDLGSLDARGTVGFSIFHAINLVGQTEADLRASLGFTGGINGIEAAALGYGAYGADAPSVLISGAGVPLRAVPEPSSFVLVAIGGLLGAAGFRRMRNRD